MARNKVQISDDESSSDLEEGVFEVERIKDKRTHHGKTQYFIKWKGFNEEYDTWEDEDNVIGCNDLVSEFNNRLNKTDSKKVEKKIDKKITTPTKKRKDAHVRTPVVEDKITRSTQKVRKDYEKFGIPYVEGIGFEHGDKLEEIVGCKPFGNDNLLYFFVKWAKKEELTWVANNHVKDKEPLLLIEFYENRLKFGYKGEEN